MINHNTHKTKRNKNKLGLRGLTFAISSRALLYYGLVHEAMARLISAKEGSGHIFLLPLVHSPAGEMDECSMPLIQGGEMQVDGGNVNLNPKLSVVSLKVD